MTKNNLAVVLIIIILSSCINTSAPTSESSVSKTATIVNTATPPATPLPSASPTTTPNPRFVQNCVKIEEQPVSLKDVTAGTVLLFTDAPEYRPFLMDIQTGEKHTLPLETKNFFLGAQVSSDGNMFAYVEGVENNQHQVFKSILWVVNAHADVVAKISFSGRSGDNLRWLDNERVVFYADQTDQDGTVLVINPLTREQHLISNELPNLLTGYISWDVNWRVEYSPNLEWVAYLGSTKHPWGGSPIVRDVTTGQTIWQAESEGNWDMPVWSPNGSQVAVIVWDEQLTKGELYLIDHSGHAKPIFVMGHKQAFAPSWSPDSKRIAFWNDTKLMIYDLQTDQTTDLCIKNEWTRQNPPTWSPDSQQLGVDTYIDASTNSVETYSILINLQKGVGYKSLEIQGGTYPDIWMNSMP